jgi:hypothetical protein
LSEKQEAPRLTGKAKGRSSLKLRKKGQSGNKCGRRKDLDNFGNLLMKAFYKTLPGRDGQLLCIQVQWPRSCAE